MIDESFSKISAISDVLPKGYTSIDYLMIFIWICIMIVMAYLAYTRG